MSAPVFRRLVIRGRVQGVGYRAFVEDEAAMRGVEGFVRNRRDGTVEAVIGGSPEAVAAMIDTCRRGPFSALVDDVEVIETAADALALRRPGERFSVLPTM
jgi:acylphosphatase